MKLRPSTRIMRGGFFVTGAIAAVLAAAAPAMASGTALYCGASRGLTAEAAIQGAVDDAQTSASGDGRFQCALVGEPQIFETFDDPYFGHLFRASVTMDCQ